MPKRMKLRHAASLALRPERLVLKSSRISGFVVVLGEVGFHNT